MKKLAPALLALLLPVSAAAQDYMSAEEGAPLYEKYCAVAFFIQLV